MRNYALAFLLIAAVAGCSQPSRFAIQNDSGEVISNVIVTRGSEPISLGSIAPGQRKEVEFSSYFETSYSLSYRKGGESFTMDLCYQGMDYPADGVVTIREAKAGIECR